MENLDREFLLDLFARRAEVIAGGDELERRYIEGRIDGHCLQNAIDEPELVTLAYNNGFRVDWQTATEVVTTPTG
jgi:hypothetical protein